MQQRRSSPVEPYGKDSSEKREFHLLEVEGKRSWGNKNIQCSVHRSLNGLSCRNEYFQFVLESQAIKEES